MIPVLYPEDEKTFAKRGYGALSDCISCIVSEELNGQYTLTLKYPKNGIHAEYLQVRNIIACQPNYSTFRDAFRIVKVNRSLKDNITVTAYHLSYDLSGLLILPATASGLANAMTLLNNASGDFTISTDKTSSAQFKVDVPSSVRSWFGGKEGSLIDIYGGEWKYNLWDCQLLAHRGEDTGTRVSYGVNIAQYVKESTDNKYSHVLSYYAQEGTVVYGDSIAITSSYVIQRTLIRDVTSEFDDVPTVAQLDTLTNSYINANRSALLGDSENIAVTPEMLGIKDVNLGDSVHVIYDEQIADVRVVKIDWDVVADRYNKIELGQLKTNIAETIKSLNEGTSTGVGSGGGSITVDSALSTTSINPVQNKVIAEALNGKMDASDSGSGHMKLADGTMILWGSETVTVGTQKVITFSTAFTATPVAMAFNMYNYPSIIDVVAIPDSTSQMTIWSRRLSGSATTALVGWMAIGRWK